MAFPRLRRNRRKRTHRQRMRLCCNCHCSGDRNKLELFHGRWLCAKCIGLVSIELVGAPIAPQEDGGERLDEIRRGRLSRFASTSAVQSALLDDEEQAPPPLTLHEQVGEFLGWLYFFGRFAFYLIFFVSATQNELARLALKGMLMADIAVWGIRVFLDLRHARLMLMLELLAFILIVRLLYQIPGALSLPADVGDRAVVGLTFMLVFTVRITFHFLRWRSDENDPIQNRRAA